MAPTPEIRLEQQIAEVQRLLARHRLLESMARRQQTDRSALLEQMQHRQNLVELQTRLRGLHPADVANILELLPPEDRVLVWGELTPTQAGQALVEVSDGVREYLIESTPAERLVALLRELDADDLRYLSDSLPQGILDQLSATLDAQDRSWVEQSREYPAGSTARLMTQDVLSLRGAQTVEEAVALIRAAGRLPTHTDRLFVVDARNVLVGAVPLGVLLIADPGTPIASVMESDIRRFHLYDEAEQVATAFERYDLLSAPVVDDRGKLIGRVTADSVMDFIRASSENEVLGLAGLRQAEDLFAPVLDSARNRWPWLAVNMGTAFIASRVIGVFEGAIQQLVALAALMPILASIGGNTGNQTVALVVRGLALDQLKGRQRTPSSQEGADGRAAERRAVGNAGRTFRDDRVPFRGARPGDDERRTPQPDHRRPRGRCRAAGAVGGGARSRTGIQRRPHVCDRQHGILPVSRAGQGLSAVRRYVVVTCRRATHGGSVSSPSHACLITSSQAIAEDATAFFSALTGYSDPPRLKALVMAPTHLRPRFVKLIDRERSGVTFTPERAGTPNHK